jgi:hypothetical protein
MGSALDFIGDPVHSQRDWLDRRIIFVSFTNNTANAVEVGRVTYLIYGACLPEQKKFFFIVAPEDRRTSHLGPFSLLFLTETKLHINTHITQHNVTYQN